MKRAHNDDRDTGDDLNTSDAARLVNKSAETIRSWERAGRLPARRTSAGHRLFRRADVLAAANRSGQ